MIYTFQPAVAGMEQEFREETQKQRSSARIRSVFAEGAREALEQNDTDTHNRIIAQTVERIKDADVVLLAHFSMARAAAHARSATDLPVLSSPETAVERLKSRILA
jgi:DNA-binding MurR/RpiR family transcriptional regulator